MQNGLQRLHNIFKKSNNLAEKRKSPIFATLNEQQEQGD
jgi:hypothetical protein